MATCVICFTPLCSATSSDKTRNIVDTPRRYIPCLGKLPSPVIRFSIAKPFKSSNIPRVVGGVNGIALGVLDDVDQVVEEEEASDLEEDNVSDYVRKNNTTYPTPCQLYVCNLPRSYDVASLIEKFKPFGTIFSVEVSRNNSGESKGCGYVTMETVGSAKAAIAALDGSDVDGREMRVRLADEMNYGRRTTEARTSIIYEGPYKVYVGNLSRITRPEYLKEEFSKVGTVASVRVFRERKRDGFHVYGFVSFQSKDERDAALALNGTTFLGRNLVVGNGNRKK